MSYSAQDLHDSLLNDGKFITINFHIADLKSAFDKNGIPFTNENIDIFLKSGGSSQLKSILVETTSTILDDMVTNIENKFNK